MNTLCGCRIMAIMSAFQAENESSIPSTRIIYDNQSAHLIKIGRLFMEFREN